MEHSETVESKSLSIMNTEFKECNELFKLMSKQALLLNNFYKKSAILMKHIQEICQAVGDIRNIQNPCLIEYRNLWDNLLEISYQSTEKYHKLYEENIFKEIVKLAKVLENEKIIKTKSKNQKKDSQKKTRPKKSVATPSYSTEVKPKALSKVSKIVNRYQKLFDQVSKVYLQQQIDQSKELTKHLELMADDLDLKTPLVIEMNKLYEDVKKCCSEINKLRGQCFEGIFRKAEEKSKLNEVILKYIRDNVIHFGYDASPNLPAELLKHILRKCINPLIPDPIVTSLCDFGEIVDSDERDTDLINQRFTQIMETIPKENCKTLKFIAKYLYGFSYYQRETRMDVNNLAIVFLPCLIRLNGMDISYMAVVYKKIVRSLIFMINYYGTL